MKITYYLARRILFTAFIAVSLIALGAALSAVSALDKYSSLINKMETYVSKNIYSSTIEDGCFIVKEHEGVIGIFTPNGKYLYAVDVYVKTLPESILETEQ